jgi:hypothetical protein
MRCSPIGRPCFESRAGTLTAGRPAKVAMATTSIQREQVSIARPAIAFGQRSSTANGQTRAVGKASASKRSESCRTW